MERGEKIGGEDNGVSSFVKFLIDGKEAKKSGTQKKTSNPSWNETFEIETNSMENPITIQTFDSGLIKVTKAVTFYIFRDSFLLGLTSSDFVCLYNTG